MAPKIENAPTLDRSYAHLPGEGHASSMDIQTIRTVFGAAVVLTIASFWLHRRLAGVNEFPGGASMAAFVAGWLSGITVFLTGAFLLMLAVSR
ncbi:MAG: hypothetical protein IT305_30435 [Chloroflexi bacterium]|nr:hypothetical protein [Chloroflexota bacterium]